MILIKSSIAHHLNVTPDLHQMEATSVTIRTTTGPITLISAYNHTGRLILDDDLSEIFNPRGPIIVAGDLNCKHPSWNSRTTNAAGRTLRGFADDAGLVVDGPPEWTYYPYCEQHRPDVLDIVVMRDVTLAHQLTTLNELSSNHNPVLLQLGDPMAAEHDRPSTRKIVSWPAFTKHLARTTDPITLIDDADQLETAVTTLTDGILNSLQYATNESPVQDSRSLIPWRIKNLIREKNRMRKRYQRTWDPRAKTDYNRLSRLVKVALDEHRSARWNDVIERCEESQGAFWKTVKMLKNSSTPMPPIQGPPHLGMALTTEDKAEVFADSIETQCSPNYEDTNVEHIVGIHRNVRRILDEDDNDPIPPASFDEVRAVLRSCKPRKASGHDGIPSRAMKSLPRKTIAALVNIINAMLRLRHFPTPWKCADVIVLKKPGRSSTRPENYRPISLLSVLGKTAERILLRRLAEQTDELNIIPDAQFGFRAEHDTTLQILRLVEHVKLGYHHRKYTGAVFLDVAKAFDKVWHQGLLYKMHQAGISLGLVKLTRSFLRNRTFRVKLRGHRSNPRTMSAGVPQGSALSPLLFNIYTSDIPTTAHVNLAMYADDVCIYTSSMSPKLVEPRLQLALDSLDAWYKTWRLRIHPEKSTAILFSRSGQRKRKHGQPKDLKIQGGVIPWRTQVKYLGVIMDTRLTWRHHVKFVSDRARQMLAVFYAMLNGRSKLDPACKIKLYKTVIRPTITYASVAWATAAKSHMDVLQRVQNRVLRMALVAPWYVRNETLHRDTGLESLEDFVRRTAEKTLERCQNHRNSLIADAVDYDPEIPWNSRRPRMIL